MQAQRALSLPCTQNPMPHQMPQPESPLWSMDPGSLQASQHLQDTDGLRFTHLVPGVDDVGAVVPAVDLPVGDAPAE